MTRRGFVTVYRPSTATAAAALVRAKGWSWREVGQHTGYSHMHCWRVLTGRALVTEPFAVALAAALREPIDVVFPVRQEAADAAD